MAENIWTNTVLKKLKALVDKGLPTSVIGEKLGISKNAVVGKLNRLGWNAKANSAAAAAAAAKKIPAKKVVSVAKNAKPTAPASKSTSAKTLSAHQRIIQHSLNMASLKPDQCRWPIGNPDSERFHFCGEPVFSGKPYCYEHCKQAYQFQPPKGKK